MCLNLTSALCNSVFVASFVIQSAKQNPVRRFLKAVYSFIQIKTWSGFVLDSLSTIFWRPDLYCIP